MPVYPGAFSHRPTLCERVEADRVNALAARIARMSTALAPEGATAGRRTRKPGPRVSGLDGAPALPTQDGGRDEQCSTDAPRPLRQSPHPRSGALDSRIATEQKAPRAGDSHEQT